MTLVKTDLGVGDWGGGAWAGTKIPMTKVLNSERGGVRPPHPPPPRSASANNSIGSQLDFHCILKTTHWLPVRYCSVFEMAEDGVI